MVALVQHLGMHHGQQVMVVRHEIMSQMEVRGCSCLALLRVMVVVMGWAAAIGLVQVSFQISTE